MEITNKVLYSGLEYLNIYSPNLNTVTLLFLVRVGSRYEDINEKGLAHFVEHTFFKGSKKYPSSKSIGMAIEKLGGTTNAYTSYEYTGYYIKVPKENFDAALDIISDIVCNPIFPDKEVEKERGVVIEEIRMYDDIPMRKVDQEFMSNLFKGHPLGDDIAGNVESVGKFSNRDTKLFVAKHYNKSNSLFIVSGGVALVDSVNKVEDSFSDLQEGVHSEFDVFDNYESQREDLTIKRKLEQSHIVIGGLGLKRDPSYKYEAKIGEVILSGGFGSILFQKIREELGLAYYIHSDHTSFDDIGFWSVNMGVDNSRLQISIEAVVESIKDFLKGNFDEDDLERAKNYAIGSLSTQIESSDSLASWYGRNLLIEKKLPNVENIKSKILKLKKDEIIEIWNKILSNKRTSIVILSGVDFESSDIDLFI